VANREQVCDWEQWNYESTAKEGEFYLKSYHGFYLSYSNSGSVSAKVTHAGINETYCLERPVA